MYLSNPMQTPPRITNTDFFKKEKLKNIIECIRRYEVTNVKEKNNKIKERTLSLNLNILIPENSPKSLPLPFKSIFEH